MLVCTILTLGPFKPTTLRAEPANPGVARPRLTAGLAFGGSFVSLEEMPGSSTSGGVDIALAWRLGYRLTDRLAIVLNGASSVYDYERPGRPRKRGFEGLFPSVLYWVTPQLWLAAGPGVNLDAPAFYDIDSADERVFHHGFGALAIAGYELHRTRSPDVGFEILARVHAGYSDVPEGRQSGSSVSLLVGVSR